ncbi:MAG: hypothetical protein IJ196_03030 [Prevotella sp.]|nr:hypothetical protein [Prevotella sp.]
METISRKRIVRLSIIVSLLLFATMKTAADNAPEATLLNVVFNLDGTATDVSPMHNTIVSVGRTNTQNYYNELYDSNVASFSNTWGGATASYYRIDYSANTDFRNALADGHSLEMLVCPNYSGTIANVEAKPFSSHQAGGTGLMVSTVSGERRNEFTFLPNVSTTGSSNWIWCTSGVVPKSQVYYHVVGVWDKEQGKARVYVDGQLCKETDANGTFRFPSSGANWFCIGGDAAPNNAELGWAGDIAIARIYDQPLTQAEVEALWAVVKAKQDNAQSPLATEVSCLSGLRTYTGAIYRIYGKGFETGDQLRVVSSSDEERFYTLPVTIVDEGIDVVMPEGILSDDYVLTLQRENREQRLGVVAFVVSGNMPKGAETIAHRGYWNIEGSAQNSRSSLQNALDADVYASEIDVWITTDGHLMVNHDASFSGVTIENATYEQCKSLTLANGETMPELQELLQMLKQSDRHTLLRIEIKTHASEARGKACVAATVQAVKEAGLQERVEYIGFSLALCRELLACDPTAVVGYLNGDLDPDALFSNGLRIMDYSISVTRNHPAWITRAHQLGILCDTWTVDATTDLVEMHNMGLDFVTTNNPTACQQIGFYYQRNYKEPEVGQQVEKPVADVLDIVFKADGTVADISKMKNTVQVVSSDNTTVPVEYSEVFGRYVANLKAPNWGGAPTAYCRVDFADNEAFRNALADGHTLEVVFKATYSGTIPNAEAKPFAAHQAGGTGFLISNISGVRRNELTFLPNVSTTGSSNWVWCTSGVVPQSDVYYHVVGVWDKENKTAKVYVNGVLCNTIAANGSMVFPPSAASWFCIGGDAAGSGKAEQGGPFQIVTARVYDKPLSDDEVNTLWDISADLPVLDEATDNTDVIEARAGASGVVLKRSVEKDTWNTVVLPFDMSQEQVEEVFGEGSLVAVIDQASSSEDGILFKTTDRIAAGRPCLLKPTRDLSSAESVGIANVVVKGEAPEADAIGGNMQYVFAGIYAPAVPDTNDYFVALGNSLKRNAAGTSLKAFRAYFKNLQQNGSETIAKRFAVDGDVLGIILSDGSVEIAEKVYTLGGQQVNGKNLKRGIYVVNGKKVAVK